jgi:hypothetical protein
MARKDGEVLPPDVKPCPAFSMSDRFRDWAVGEMRREVLGQVKAAGLDRMALIKSKGKTAGDGEATPDDKKPSQRNR